eukprot:6210014-Pleurochrysis_carterae.AAC.3
MHVCTHVCTHTPTHVSLHAHARLFRRAACTVEQELEFELQRFIIEHDLSLHDVASLHRCEVRVGAAAHPAARAVRPCPRHIGQRCCDC